MVRLLLNKWNNHQQERLLQRMLGNVFDGIRASAHLLPSQSLTLEVMKTDQGATAPLNRFQQCPRHHDNNGGKGLIFVVVSVFFSHGPLLFTGNDVRRRLWSLALCGSDDGPIRFCKQKSFSILFFLLKHQWTAASRWDAAPHIGPGGGGTPGWGGSQQLTRRIAPHVLSAFG